MHDSTTPTIGIINHLYFSCPAVYIAANQLSAAFAQNINNNSAIATGSMTIADTVASTSSFEQQHNIRTLVVGWYPDRFHPRTIGTLVSTSKIIIMVVAVVMVLEMESTLSCPCCFEIFLCCCSFVFGKSDCFFFVFAFVCISLLSFRFPPFQN